MQLENCSSYFAYVLFYIWHFLTLKTCFQLVFWLPCDTQTPKKTKKLKRIHHKTFKSYLVDPEKVNYSVHFLQTVDWSIGIKTDSFFSHWHPTKYVFKIGIIFQSSALNYIPFQNLSLIKPELSATSIRFNTNKTF